MNMKSKKLITSSELEEYFGISLINETHLGLMNASGNIAYELKSIQFRSIQLVKASACPQPGLYLVKILQVIVPGEPEYSCADCGTCTPWNKIEELTREARVTKTIIVG